MWRVKPLSAIELRHLRYFLAAAEHGSFRKAGLALAVQESSISRRIRDLEDGLGASLFQRHSSGVVLTLAGCELLRQARTAMKHLGDGARNVGSIGRSESGHLRVGILSSLASGFLAELLHTYGADRKGVQVDFSDGDPMDHVAAVRLHELDVAFIAGSAEHAGCETMALWTEQVFAALPSDHALADRQTLIWLDLVGNQFIVSEQASGHEVCDLLMKRLSGLERYPQVRRQNVGRDNLMSLVAIGRGLTLTSEAATSTSIPGLVYRPIESEFLPFSVVWSPKNDNPALRRLLSMARARSRTMRSIEPPRSVPIPPNDEPSQSPDPSP